MKTFRQHLRTKLVDPSFQDVYEEERRLLELSLRVLEARKQAGLSQQQLAQKAQITQQQLSKIEHGMNCNMTTFLRVCAALGLNIEIGEHHTTVSA